MSTYLHRIIEVKNKDGKWETLKWYTPFKKKWDGDKPDIDVDNPCPLASHNMVFDNSPTYRELLDYDDNLSDRGIPSDCSDETSKIIKEYGEWSWGYTCMTLSELCHWSSTERTKLIRNMTIEYNNHQFKKINKKLDCILNKTEYKEGNKATISDEYDGEYETEENMLSYYMTEGIDEYLSILYEVHWVEFVSTELSPEWHSSENVRIIYFYH